MMTPGLRPFRRDAAVRRPAPSVSIRLRDLRPLLARTAREQEDRLQGLGDQYVLVTRDLADIIRAFRAVGPSA